MNNVRFFFCLAFLSAVCFGAETEGVRTLPGETQLSAADAEKIITELPAFKEKKCVKAHLVTEVDDLLGARKDEGEFLLDRSGRVLRRFAKPAGKAWVLDGTQIQEYAPTKKLLFVKDFSKAPKALKLIQAAFTGDLSGLKELFDLHAFQKGTSYRFVLTKKASVDNALLHRKIEAQIEQNAAFFHFVEYTPENGDKIVEHYTEITEIPKPGEKDFALELPPDVQRKVENVSDSK